MFESIKPREEGKPVGRYKAIKNYIEVLKPRETSLLTFIGACAAIAAGQGYPPWDLFFLALVAIALGSGGCNGLTNYIDREVDARMYRARHRVLPSKRIDPAEKVLPLTIGLVVVALALAWILHPFCFFAGLVGTVAALIGRKMAVTHLLGGISGCAPVVIGWLAIDHQPNLALLFVCLLIMIWVPIHVWSVMLAYRDDYLQAGVHIFPVTWGVRDAIKILLTLSLLLCAVSIALYFASDFGWLYPLVASFLGLLMVYANIHLLVSGASQDAWRVYKLSAFPYLGLIFLAICLDLWLL